MIVPMKKVYVVARSKDAEFVVKKLRSLAVVHVEHQQPPEGKDFKSIQEDIDLADSAINILSRQQKKVASGQRVTPPSFDWKSVSRHIIDLDKRLDQLKEFAHGLRNRIIEWGQWGNFDPQAIHFLSEKGVFIRLYQIPAKEIKNIPAGLIVKKISTVQGIANCAIVSLGKIALPYKEVALPKSGLEAMRRRLKEDISIEEFLQKEIRKLSDHLEGLVLIKDSLQKEWFFYQALNGMGQAEGLSYLVGYVPGDSTGLIIEAAKTHSWAIKISEPSLEDSVPTFIRNPKWVAIISPIFKLMEVVPGYRELDISPVFLVFFSIFFGMLIGDAGIGLIFLFLTLLAQVKFGKRLKEKSIFVLFYFLSSCAVIWGVLSGTFFGQGWLPQTFRPLLPVLRNDKSVQALCFLLGALHLSIGHGWRAAIKLPSLAALSDIGWILIIWAGFFLAKVLVLGESFAATAKYLFMTGSFLVIFFTRPDKNILRGIGSGLGSFLLNVVNSFTDVVSYIRLFAVGLATVAVADSFNSMAMGIGFDGIFKILGAGFILLLGHGLNVLLGPMSVLVHGIRLNVLEFCSHADIKWSGFPYRPLRD